NLALNYLETNKDSMIYYMIKAETIFKKHQNHWALGHIYNNVGGVYLEMDKPDEALGYLIKARNEHISVQDDRGLCATQVSLGLCWLEKDKTSIAKIHLDTAISMAIKMEMKEDLADAYHNYALVYSRLGILDSVTKYLAKETTLRDSIFSDEKTKVIADMQTKYDTEKKDLEIAKQTAELEAKENATKRRDTLIIALASLLVLGIALGYFVYSRNKIKEKARLDAEIATQKDLRSKAVIEAEEKERRRIAQDLHDGVGQILSAAKLNLSGLESKLKPENDEQKALLANALDLVNDSVKEVRTVSHNMMPNTLIKLGLASAVREFITKIGTVPNLKIDLQILGMEERLENTIETVLYRVIQEVVSNIIKHAKANVISMQLIRHEDDLTIMIEDNGIGFDKAKIAQAEGIGLKNIISRVEFLNGQVDFDTTPGQGTTVVIEVPLRPVN
ncbi:MAG TPA: sensor histidine kinase, partial [Bacteroidia bacterium]